MLLGLAMNRLLNILIRNDYEGTLKCLELT